MCIKIKENIGEKESTETRTALRYHGNPLNSQIFIQYKSRIIFIFEKRFYEDRERKYHYTDTIIPNDITEYLFIIYNSSFKIPDISYSPWI